MQGAKTPVLFASRVRFATVATRYSWNSGLPALPVKSNMRLVFGGFAQKSFFGRILCRLPKIRPAVKGGQPHPFTCMVSLHRALAWPMISSSDILKKLEDSLVIPKSNSS